MNEAEVESSGYSRDEIIGQATEVYGQDPKQGATQREIIERTLRDGAWRGDVVNYASDGRAVTIDCRTQVIRDGDGEPLFLCGIATDITRRRHAEDALRQRNRELAMLHRVGQTLASTLD